MRRDEHRENDAGHRAHHRRLRGVPRKVSEVRNGETQARRRRDDRANDTNAIFQIALLSM